MRPRPYYKGFSRKEDEKLANELFYGTSTIDKKTGRERDDYPPVDSPEEHRAIEALQRLLWTSKNLDEGVLIGLTTALEPGGSRGRRLVFKPRKSKKKAGYPSDLEIALYVRSLGPDAKKAAQQAVVHFGLKAKYAKKGVYDALKRVRIECPWLTQEDWMTFD
jgi:hypothetical protein